MTKEAPRPITLRWYLLGRTMLDTGCNLFLAMEAVSTTALEHPEWDLEELRTWGTWERYLSVKG